MRNKVELYKYKLNEVLMIIKYANELKEIAKNKGRFDLIDSLIDAERIVELSNLTPLQAETFDLYYRKNYTMDSIGTLQHKTHQAVADCLNYAKDKIQKILDLQDGTALYSK